nr:zinc finger, CCHC-type, retrotransposon Gag domain protein [Tanacetum cinerariifolium]
VTIYTWLERFNKQKPHSFEKATTPVDGENWISHMERIFDVMGCEDAFKTRLAVYKFEVFSMTCWVPQSSCWYRGGVGKELSVGSSQVPSSPGVPLRATPTQFALRVDADTQESVIELLADKKPGASGRVFAITEDHATKTSDHFNFASTYLTVSWL